jgi:hypothetical protein
MRVALGIGVLLLIAMIPSPSFGQLMCSTQMGTCPMMINAYPGSPCYCQTMYGQVWGAVVQAGPSYSPRHRPPEYNPQEDPYEDEEEKPPVRKKKKRPPVVDSSDDEDRDPDGCDSKKYPDLCK